jgi:hypothetical protein
MRESLPEICRASIPRTISDSRAATCSSPGHEAMTAVFNMALAEVQKDASL